MEVILLQKVANLGNIGDKVKVKPGFGRNFLLPQGKAALATAANVAKFEERRAELEKHRAPTSCAARRSARPQLEELQADAAPPRPAAKASCSARRHRRHRRGADPARASRSSAAKCACRAARSAWSASTTSSCTCTPTSTSTCRSLIIAEE